MNLDMIQQLFTYNYDAHDRVWHFVNELPAEKYTQALDYSVGSIHNQLVHVMAVDNLWLQRLQGESPSGLWSPDDFPDREAVRARWDANKQDVLDFVAAIDPNTLGDIFHYKNMSGKIYTMPLWSVLMHMINHGTDHRAQILAGIHQLGGETDVQDLLYFIRDDG